MNFAKGLAMGTGLPLIGINHLEAHIYSAWLARAYTTGVSGSKTTKIKDPKFPLIALIVSGGHTELVLMRDHLQYERLGGTLDDAAGEAFDKVARLLDLSYPGGPAIQEESQNGDPAAFNFPRAWLKDTWNFSFSGLKTAVLREVRSLQEQGKILPVSDLAASFQAAVVDVLVTKTVNAAKEFKAEEILVAGGVSANQSLRETVQQKSPCSLQIPPIYLCTDNAAMVAGAGYFRFANGYTDELGIDVLPNWPLSEL
jgi:N6-L-threonylcarbamoyladenine synthase